jgi:Na+-transporting NADH:ubiquinone oxidoreductase subunit E
MASTNSFTLILLGSTLANNILLAKFLGMCSFIAISRSMRTAFGMGAAVSFVTLFTTLLNYLIYTLLLQPGSRFLPELDFRYLSFLIFILVIAGFVQLVEMFLERFLPALYFNLGIYLPLITVNCAILGVNLFMIDQGLIYDFWQTAVYALGSGLGFWLAICLMAGIRHRLREADIPLPLQGLGMAVIITGLMAMAFMGFTGMVN